MALMFGEQLDDVSTDEEALADFLDLARSRAATDDEGPLFSDADLRGVSFDADPDPGFGKPGIEDKIIPDSAFDPPKGRAVSARIQKDVRAKTAFMLTAVGGVWQSRDRHCGGVFMDSVPEVSEALADIFCDSPDIVKWFTASGKYMKYMTLVMALQPVVTTIAAHHVFHSIDEQNDEPGAAADWSQYRAGS